jgi:hypothetical protein
LQITLDDQQDAMVRVKLRKGGHHFLKGGLVVHHLVCWREGVVHTELVQEDHQLAGDDVPQRHLAGDLDAVDLELAGDALRRIGHLGIAE